MRWKPARGARELEQGLSPRATLSRAWFAAGRAKSRSRNPPGHVASAEAQAAVT